METQEKGKEKENENGTDFKEEILILDRPIVLKNQPRKLNSKILGKKTILGRVGRLKASVPKPKPKKSNAEFLVDSIIKTYWTAKWKEQLTIMKFSRIGFNKKRADFRSLCMKLNHSMKYHQYLYLAKLFDKMEQLPAKPEVKHDESYGKLKLVYKNDNKMNENNDKVKQNDNIVIDDDFVKVEIKIDIPQVVEVEYKPEDEIKIEKNDERENKNKEIKIEKENESVPRLIMKNKKIIKRKINDIKINQIKEEKGDNHEIHLDENTNKNKIREEIIETKKEKQENNEVKNKIENKPKIINKSEIGKKREINFLQNLNKTIKEVTRDIKLEKEEKNENKTKQVHMEIIGDNNQLKDKDCLKSKNINPINKEFKINKEEKQKKSEGINDKKEENNDLRLGRHMSNSMKRFQENYLGANCSKENSEKKRKSVEHINYNEDMSVDEDIEENYKMNRKRKMSDFYCEYDDERIKKSKRLQFKLKKLKKLKKNEK